MNHRNLQKGFSTIVVLLVILGLAIVAGVAIAVAEHHKTDTSHLSKKSAVTQSTTSGKSTTSTQSSATSENQNSDIFLIPEIHAKVTLANGLTATDLKYVITTSTGVPTANFTTSTLENADAGSSCTAENGALGAIWRTTQAPPSQSQVVKQIGQYYYYFEEPQQPCSANQNTEQLETTQITELKQAFETLTATN